MLNCAYGVYTLPPLKIDEAGAERAWSASSAAAADEQPAGSQQRVCAKRCAAWMAKTDNPIIIFENYPFTDRGWYLPAFTPHSLGESVNATQGHLAGRRHLAQRRQ